ncbi:MAG: hypothetical protein MHPSP_001414, partial [Paramarteilia canceri]
NESSEEIFKRVQAMSGVKELMVFTQSGLCVRSSIDPEKSAKYGAHVQHISQNIQNLMREIDPHYPAQLIRINSSKHEMVIAHGEF